MSSKAPTLSSVYVVAGQIAIVCLVLLVWELVAHLWVSARFYVSAPSAVGWSLWGMISTGELFVNAGITGAEASVGLIIGTGVGATAGLAMWFSNTSARIARPFVLALGAVPIFAFAPLMIVWFGIGFSMKAALATFATVFLAFSQSYRGATKVSRELLETFRGMRAPRKAMFWKVVVPSALDWVLHSMRLNVGLALLGAFIGEFIAAERGLGHLVLRAAGLYDVTTALAGAFGIIALALALDACGAIVERQRHRIIQIVSVPPLLWHWRH